MNPTPDGDRAALQEVYAGSLARAPEHDIDPTLDRVAEVLDLLGNPQRAYRGVHIGGTNGKTSTVRMIERLVREHGLRTGCFTSPHLSSVTERIMIDGEPVDAERFVGLWQDVAPYVHMVDARSQAAGHPRLSFFEVLTVMAYAAFADAPVDVAVVEVGMGGRWDATNVADGDVSVITPISLDHTRWLGDRLEDVAGEKAGIVKNGSTVIVAEQPEAVEGVLLAAAATRGARVLREGVDLAVADRRVAVGGQMLDLQTPAGLYTEIYLPLHGAHQGHNALLALAATEALLRGGGPVAGEVVEMAFADVTSPGRLELVRSSPPVLVDAAHNPAGAAALADTLTEAFDFARMVGVVAVLADKDAEGILGVLEPVLDEVVVTASASPRALEADDLVAIAQGVFGPDRVHLAERLDDAVALAVDLVEQGLADEPAVGAVVVTGSITVVAEARILFGRP